MTALILFALIGAEPKPVTFTLRVPIAGQQPETFQRTYDAKKRAWSTWYQLGRDGKRISLSNDRKGQVIQIHLMRILSGVERKWRRKIPTDRSTVIDLTKPRTRAKE